MTLAFVCGRSRGRETEDWVLVVAAGLLSPDDLEVAAVLPSTLLPLTGATVGFLTEDVEG